MYCTMVISCIYVEKSFKKQKLFYQDFKVNVLYEG